MQWVHKIVNKKQLTKKKIFVFHFIRLTNMTSVQLKDYIYDLIPDNVYIIREVEGNWGNWKVRISTSWKCEANVLKFIKVYQEQTDKNTDMRIAKSTRNFCFVFFYRCQHDIRYEKNKKCRLEKPSKRFKYTNSPFQITLKI